MKLIITEKQEKMLKGTKEIFLGGTCNGDKWRECLIPMLEIPFFNPVVKNWTEKDAKREIEKRKTCDWLLYVITPAMEGVLSIAEVVEDSIKRSNKTIFCIDDRDDDGKEFTKAQLKSLEAVKKMVKENGAHVCESLFDVAKLVNNK